MTGTMPSTAAQPSTSKTPVTTKPELDFSVLCKFINKFDGSRDKLNAFINNCRSAIDFASQSQQFIILKYIISQLEGRAETACSIKDFETWEQLEEFLKSQFGERKHYAALLSDLQASRQANSESVNQFALRIESCLSKLLTEINISIPTKKKGELAGRVAAMQDLALHTFVIGLNPQLSTVVRCRDPETLNEAINFATSEEKINQTTLRSRSLPFHNFNQARTPNRQIPNGNQNRIFPPHGMNVAPRPNPLVCRYCKIPGHTIEVCRKRQFNNRFGAQNQNFNQRPTQNFNAQGRQQPINVVYPPEEGIDEPDRLNAQNLS
jgi:hypothetical protein